MNKHLSKRFDEALLNLQNMTAEMGKLTEQQFTIMHDFLRNNAQRSELEKIEALDEKVNQYHLNINQECVRLTATRAPVAVDLRYLSATDRIATDFERIGDELTKIARFLLSEDVDTDSKLWQELRPTARLAHSMLSRIINVIARIDIDEAIKLLHDDRELDANYASVTRQLITYMMEDPRYISQAVNVLFAAKALERVGDHSMNIAEAIIFYDKGHDIRHKTPDEVSKLLNY
ncbi:phosphate signaling complex protein PhoU [Cardiobacteriaceae bacterium TAE3-ERU3]|nr:phosphate signaling complex protein PhoU [Cardiobacteriaceae bacterium TAE3-ERU3]